MSISKWLDTVVVKQHQIERKAGKGNPVLKDKDYSFEVLKDLYDKGYDYVTWIRTNHEAKCALCQFYDTHETTWRLADFLGLARLASEESDIMITAAVWGPWEELDDSEKLSVLRTPKTAYNYAVRMGILNMPEEVLEKIVEDDYTVRSYIQDFLNITDTEPVPKIIIDEVGGDGYFVDKLYRAYSNQDNYPEELKFRGMTEVEVSKRDQRYYNTTYLIHNAPLYEHSHVGCKCQLMVWKSKDPEDIVFVDASGLK